jgi:hypothetical protein
VFGFYFLRDLGFVALIPRAWVFVKTILLKTLLTAFVKWFLNNKKGCFYQGITPYGPFRYFMFLIDASTKWSHVCLLSTHNVAFARLLAQIIRLQAQLTDYPIQSIRMDNAGEFTFQAFYDYFMSTGINVEHPIPHTHTQNGLAESFIKQLQLIARPLLMKTKLHVFVRGHAILHAASLVWIKPIIYQKHSPL